MDEIELDTAAKVVQSAPHGIPHLRSEDQEPRPIRPRLAKRLAEAAQGLVPRGYVYLVAPYLPDGKGRYAVKPFRTLQGAEDYKGLDPDLGIFGPYEADPPHPEVDITNVVSVDSVQVIVNGTALEPLPGAKFDAIFWGYPAVQKFVLPYYTGASGLDIATQINGEYIKPETYFLAHSHDTEYEIFGLRGRDEKYILVPLL